MVGKSTQATSSALEASGALRVAGIYPTEWTIVGAETIVGSRIVNSKFDEETYTVSTATSDNLVSVWNAKRQDVADALAKLSISPKIDPKKAALQLGTIAGSLAALAYSLQENSSKPDWYIILTEKEVS